MNTPVSVLAAIARECKCAVGDIEVTLEKINGDAGLAPRPLSRLTLAEARLDAIRRWLATPEAGSVIDQTRTFVAQNRSS